MLLATVTQDAQVARAEAAPLSPISRIHFGPEAGLYLPSSSKASNRFGDTWFSIGVGFGAVKKVERRGRISPDFDLFYQTHNSNHAFFLPVGVSYKRAFPRSGRLVPFVGASLNGVITDIRSDQDGIQSRYRPAYGGSLFAGTNYGRHAFFEARYFAFTRVRSIDLSGLNLKAGYRF